MKLFTIIFFFCVLSSAAVLDCQVLINLDIVAQSTVITKKREKILVYTSDKITSYITELAPNVFSVEAFIPDIESRIYSEGSLSNFGESLRATAWTRDVLAEVGCTLRQ